jgi:hypothetical protein
MTSAGDIARLKTSGEVYTFSTVMNAATHRRGAEDAKITQRLESNSTLCAPSVFSVSLR